VPLRFLFLNLGRTGDVGRVQSHTTAALTPHRTYGEAQR
jgi:hypothetical protein